MKLLAKNESTNGRWGMQIVCPDDYNGNGSVHQGTLKSLGCIGGVDCFEFTPKAGNWIIVGGDLTDKAGCSIAYKKSMQSGNYATILVARPGAIWTNSGYQGRSIDYYMLLPDGTAIKPDPAIMLAAGLIKAKEETEIEIPDAPELDGALQAALKKAGLL